MVRDKYNIHYTNALALTAIATISTLFMLPQPQTSATTLTVTAEEMLTVQVTTPTVTPSGTPTTDGTFLLNTVGLTVATNNANGFSASMTTETATTALRNELDSSVTIPVLTESIAKSSFPANYWGFSTDDSTYGPIAASGTTPTYVASSAASDSVVSRNLYFGAKANTSKAAGTYSNTVIISVVSGVNTNNPTTPTDPVTPSGNTGDSDITDTTPTYQPANAGGSASGATVYTRTSTDSVNHTTTTGTTVTTGNTVGSTYVSPAGVVSTTAAIVDEGTPLATGLAVTAGVAAAAGAVFFIIAKRRREDEDEEDY